MSRSYKKVGAYPWAGGSDKWNRSRYHRDERRKVKALLKEQELHGTAIEDCEFDESPWEKIVLNKVDYSLHSADKWSWASDGGSYWQEDLSSIRKTFNRDVFGSPKWSYREAEIWDRYVAEREARHNKKHPQLSVNILYRRQKPKCMEDYLLNQLGIEYKPVYEELKKRVLIPYNKSHKIPESVFEDIDGEIIKVNCYKHTGPKQLNHPKWDIIEYSISIAPTTLHGPKDLIEWLRAHQEEIISKMFKIRYQK